jgi:hypothetical protein
MSKYNPKSFKDVKKDYLKLREGDTIYAQKDIIVSDKFTINKYDEIIISEIELDSIWFSIGDKIWDLAVIVFISDDLDIGTISYLFHENFFTKKEYDLEVRRNKIDSVLENK